MSHSSEPSLQAHELGAELIEFIGILPWLLIVALIIWQIYLAGHTIVVTASAAREGARTFAVCGGNAGQAVDAVNRASPGYHPRVELGGGSGSVIVTVYNQIPTIPIPYLNQIMPEARSRAIMRQERCY